MYIDKNKYLDAAIYILFFNDGCKCAFKFKYCENPNFRNEMFKTINIKLNKFILIT